MEEEFAHLFGEAFPVEFKEAYEFEDGVPERHMLKVFPEAAPVARRLLKEAVAGLNGLLVSESLLDNAQLGPWDDYCVRLESIYRPRELLERKARSLEAMLRWQAGSNGAFDRAKERAKSVPVEEHVKFSSSGFGRCVWHEERTASMKLYRDGNRVHCFGCGKSGDVIDVVMAISGCPFVEAVRMLSG